MLSFNCPLWAFQMTDRVQTNFIVFITKFGTEIRCFKMFQDSKKVFMKSWIKPDFHFLKKLYEFFDGWICKVFCLIVMISFFHVLNIVFNMNLFIWNRSDHGNAHNQRWNTNMLFGSFLWKLHAFKHMSYLENYSFPSKILPISRILIEFPIGIRQKKPTSDFGPFLKKSEGYSLSVFSILTRFLRVQKVISDSPDFRYASWWESPVSKKPKYF